MIMRNLDDINETIAFVKQQMLINPSNGSEKIVNNWLLSLLEDEKRKVIDTKLTGNY